MASTSSGYARDLTFNTVAIRERAGGVGPHGAGSRMSVQGQRVMVAADGSVPKCRGAALAVPVPQTFVCGMAESALAGVAMPPQAGSVRPSGCLGQAAHNDIRAGPCGLQAPPTRSEALDLTESQQKSGGSIPPQCVSVVAGGRVPSGTGPQGGGDDGPQAGQKGSSSRPCALPKERMRSDMFRHSRGRHPSSWL